MNNNLGKEYKLCSKLMIDTIFESGTTAKSYPFIAKYKLVDADDIVPFKFVISAPKKTFNKAVDRNRIKRVSREAVRLNKSILETYLKNKNKQLALFLIYSSNEEMDQKVLHQSIAKLFNTIIKTINGN